MGPPPDYHGNLVALEGSPEVVSTQLRLLPTSPQILVLPSIQNYIKPKSDDTPFDARAFIREVHEASTIRRQQALDFLKKATPSRKRLVFLNGGTVSAHTLCITAIRQQEGIEGYSKAEAIFTELVKDGLAGLVGPTPNPRQPVSGKDSHNAYGYEEVEIEDASTLAMRAAEVLDQETQSLQPNELLDLDKTRPRSFSLPSVSVLKQAAAEDLDLTVTDAPVEGGASSPATSVAGRTRLLEEAPKFQATLWDPACSNTLRMSTCSSIVATYAYAPSYNLPRPVNELACLSPLPELPIASPTSPGNTVIEQAEILDMAPLAKAASLRRVRSLDRMFPTRGLSLRINVPTEGASRGITNRKRGDGEDTRCFSWVGVPGPDVSSRPRPANLDLRRAVVCKANQTTISRSASRRKPETSLRYVDKGTDAFDIDAEPGSIRGTAQPVSGPALPFTEDLVIHFTGDVHHLLFESIMQGFRTGVYPVVPISSDESYDIPDFPATPSTTEWPAPLVWKKSASASVASASDEYDPYRPQSEYARGRVIPPSKLDDLSMPAVNPPTPAQTPPPHTRNPSDKFRVLSIGRKSSISVQNVLRSELSTHYSSDKQGFSQQFLSTLPDMDNLWRLLFEGVTEPNRPNRDSKNSLAGSYKKHVDLVLAIGADEAVEEGFSASVLEQLGRIGNVSMNGGVAKSGHLNLRYLIANALRQPLDHTQEDPLGSPMVLAALIIPHLDMYLAAHPDVRFMILEYPASHLPTVLAMQKLMGDHIVQVAGIVPEQKPPRRRGSNRSIQATAQTLQSFTIANQTITLAGHSDITLAATAKQDEVSAFISDIWHTLIDASDFYTIDQMPTKTSKKESRPVSFSRSEPPSGALPRLPSSSVGTQTVPEPQGPPETAMPSTSTRRGTHTRRRSPSPTPSTKSRAFSIASFRTTKTAKSRATRRITMGTMGTTGGGAESILDFYDPAEESDYDLEERRLMPLYMTRGQVPRKANTRKALKWLGLA
ncbi:hypothetical protein PpBr36_07442 [Pyricularia pennisetigena]|uniref:hypothetical protein n=1 Tax=Pyricularia pennisetigena TaxID=1578925 RepID=UPI00114F4B0B|nr:hypothetical protein PpBr36_07442 [Pyricularia pennisetigena]TLS26078.1 hypothetical protein PpBr36_07442 [Pyricularia pennisetigena]